MPFVLKIARTTYQQLVNKVLTTLIGKTMEVCINDMITKNVKEIDYMGDLDTKAFWNEAQP